MYICSPIIKETTDFKKCLLGQDQKKIGNIQFSFKSKKKNSVK